ncbi:MAG: hypothetical protein ABJN34_06715 [Litoreibacter sp.]|uniref:hypothetical protein n=1 Tax=Litoreibacter sp. TaxID=1969459 RepID=UPI0032995A4C
MKLVSFLFAMILSNPCWAKPATVKSGEHDSFSRLVLYTGESQTWSLAQESNIVTVAVEGWTEDFDISEIFTTLHRVRVLNVNTTPRSLVLTLGCECVLDISALKQVGIMIDVKNKVSTRSRQSPLLFPEHRSVSERSLTLEERRKKSAQTTSVKDLQQKLTRQLGHAATQGLLLPIPDPSFNLKKANLPVENLADPPEEIRLRTTSASERATQRLSSQKIQSTRCPNPSFGDIENWGTGLPFSSQLGEIRGSVTGEFDTIDHSKAIQLAQLYLYFAMGVEAISVLDILSKGSPKTNFLRSLALVLDGSGSEVFLNTISPQECPGSMAIWFALLDKHNSSISEAQSKMISEAFGKLPHPLKTMLGPTLIARLQQSKHEIAASIIQNSISLQFEQNAQAARKTLELTRSSSGELIKLVSQNNDLSAKAVAQIIRSNIDQGHPTLTPMRDVAMSYVVQQKGDPISNEIAYLLIKNEAIQGSYIQALNSALDVSVEATRDDLLNYIAMRVIRSGRDIDVAKFALRLISKKAQAYLSKNNAASLTSRLQDTAMRNIINSIFQKKASSSEISPSKAIAPKVNSFVKLEQTALKEDQSYNLQDAAVILNGSRLMKERLLNLLNKN